LDGKPKLSLLVLHPKTPLSYFFLGNMINPLMPELNPSKQGCLPEFFLGILNFIAYS
jgi:hypothetical protein